MKLKTLIWSIFLFVFITSCSPKEQPQIDFTISVQTGEITVLTATSVEICYNVVATNASITRIGVATWRDDQLVDNSSVAPSELGAYVFVKDLTPGTLYTCSAWVEYIDPNTGQKEIKHGVRKSFTTKSKTLSIEQPHFQVTHNYTIRSYRDGQCPISILSNYGPLTSVVVEVSSTPDFSNVLYTRDMNSSLSYENLTFELPQGKYYCRAKCVEEGLVSNIEIIRVITSSGHVIEDGYVDLGLESLWSAKFYSEPFKNERSKYLFAVSTTNSFDGIKEIEWNFSGTKYDIITDRLGQPYRLPSLYDIESLMHCCKWEQDGDSFIISGCKGDAIRVRFCSDDYISGLTGGYNLNVNVIGSSELSGLAYAYAYRLGELNGKLSLLESRRSLGEGVILWPLKNIED